MAKELPQNVHFVGIGGAGMSGLAALLLSRGCRVTGSDLKASPVIGRLEAQGATCYLGHAAGYVGTADLVVISSAIKPDNPEVVAARERCIPIVRRGELLAKVMDGYRGIAVAGAHGKTTTTAMVAAVLIAGGLDPTVLVGGEWPVLGGNFCPGGSRFFVTEADESDASFLLLSPEVAVVTNVENDHLDFYGTTEAIARAFREFVGRVQPGGVAVLCLEDPWLEEFAKKNSLPVITCGRNGGADYVLGDFDFKGLSSAATLYFRGEPLGRLELNLPGIYNLLNAASAVAVGRHLGISFDVAAQALAAFRNVKRRFELLGEVNGIRVVDDYAHHPTEVAATISAARQLKPARIVAVFQPHRYTRTALLYREFGRSFGDADVVVVDEIYSAGETPLPGVSADLIREAIARHDGREVLHLPENGAAAYIRGLVRPGDVVLTLGAGNIYRVGLELLGLLEERQ